MNARIERTLRILHENDSKPRTADYWRQRPASERLIAVLTLHREGNILFKGGNLPFQYEFKVQHVRTGR